ncbi:MAG TPA: hypothetical protein VNU46_01040 [Gemmatimonadaceae bacterium]|nr:hypothetical protein [Gemmatimonadaceae bacterium]
MSEASSLGRAREWLAGLRAGQMQAFDALAALTFARPSQMHTRLRAIVDTTPHRAGVSRRGLLMTWGTTLSCGRSAN